MAHVYERAVVHAGATVGSEVATPLTGWLAVGLIGRL